MRFLKVGPVLTEEGGAYYCLVSATLCMIQVRMTSSLVVVLQSCPARSDVKNLFQWLPLNSNARLGDLLTRLF